MKKLLFLLLFVFISCQKSDVVSVETINQNNGNSDFRIKIKNGQVGELPNKMKISFVNVESDSRCPTGAVCIHEGWATITILIEASNGSKATFNLKCNSQKEVVEQLGYKFYAEQLDPFPKINVPNKYEEYIATIYISKI